MNLSPSCAVARPVTPAGHRFRWDLTYDLQQDPLGYDLEELVVP